MKSCPEIIRGLREDKDLKQSEIAAIIKTTQQQYSKYEAGKSDVPMRVLTTLADFYSVSVDYLVGRTDCVEGVNGLNRKINKDYSIGKIITEILALSPDGRDAVIDYISMKSMKETYANKS